MSHTPLPPCPQESAPLVHVFAALAAMNGPLPAELKFRENTVEAQQNRGGRGTGGGRG